MPDLEPLIRGDSRVMGLVFADKDGKAIDITGWTVYFTAKKYLWQSNGDAVLSKDVTEHNIPIEGKTEITLLSEDTKDLRIGTYFYDIKIKKVDGNVLTVVKGNVEVIINITRRI